jgi:hypothetical protein
MFLWTGGASLKGRGDVIAHRTLFLGIGRTLFTS